MSDSSSQLHALVHERFLAAFGPPDSSLGRDDHWSLKPSSSTLRINVLVNGTANNPAVWVFDPNDNRDGVLRTIITDEDTLNKLVATIQQRIDQARTKGIGTS